MWRLWNRIVSFWKRYEHHIGVGAIAIGFFFDLLLADRPDSVANNLLLLSYLFIAGAFIVILNLREMRANKSAEPLFLLLVLQFCYGGLASNLLVLYGRSGTFVGSAIFLGLMGALVLGNEYLRGRYTVLRFNVAVYYFLLLSYCLIAVPTFIFHSVGTLVFVLSGVVSLVIIAIFLAVLYAAVLRKTKVRGLYDTSIIVVIIFCIFNGLYFLNVIPPVPLSLKSVGIYHTVLRQSGGSYLVTYQPAPIWQFWKQTSGSYTAGPGESAFCFSSVFAPTGLSAGIYHRWEKYDEAAGEWRTMARVSFSISGGRDGGYRGWTMKSALTEGKWRCDVETAGGALIGRASFTVVEASSTPQLVQGVL